MTESRVTTGGVAVLARLVSRPIPRLMRVATVLEELGFAPRFVGAYRDADLPQDAVWNGIPVRRVGVRFPMLNGTRPFFYVWAVLRFNLGLWNELRRARPDVVHASDIETMPASVLYQLFHRTFLIYNVHDNLAQRYRLPRLVNQFLNGCEGIAVICSDVTLVPEGFRRDSLPAFCRSRIRVFRNTPIDPGYSPKATGAARPKVFYGGWLDWQRGVRQMVDAAEGTDVEIVVAGEGASEIVGFLAGRPNVTYRGYLSNADCLDEMRNADLIVATYDPSREINIFSASNKIAEGLALGRPLLVNKEMKIAQYLMAHSACIDVPYAEVPEWRKVFQKLATEGERLAAIGRAARQCYERDYLWSRVRNQVVDDLAQAGLARRNGAGRK